MPVHREKKCTTPNLSDSTEGQAVPGLPEQQEFQQHLRDLARAAIRVVLQDVMREELDALIGVSWGESSPKRKGYRNGYYQRDLTTTTGRIEALRVPEIVRASSILRSDDALPPLRTVGRSRPDRDVRGRGKSP